jgi:ATP-dependent Clp endopeptidase proteolytic subunit ClpP
VDGIEPPPYTFFMSETNEPKTVPASSAAQPFTPIDQHLFESRTIFVSGEVNSELAVKVNRQLLALERANPAAPIVLWIDCPGGEVYSGFSIYDTAQFIAPRVITLVSGLAASSRLLPKKPIAFRFPMQNY